MVFHWGPKNAFSSLLRIVSQTYQWTWKQLNTFSKTNIVYRDLVCHPKGGIYRLSGGYFILS